MGTYSDQTKLWLRNIIKQRRFLIKFNKSHLPQVKAETAINNIEVQLRVYPYDHDVYMARFIRQHVADIDAILPGYGSTCYNKRQKEFADIRAKAFQLEEQLSESLSRCGKLKASI